jgi:tRNA modification GTPase
VTDTIFALSSGPTPAAIAVMRISGPGADAALQALVGGLPVHRRLSLRDLRHPEGGELLDRALVVRFPADASVTGEPLVELHLHGGRATVRAVDLTLQSLGLRAARAGEFTWRAFENGRLDLMQVESLSHLLRSETDVQRRAALAGHGLSRQVDGWREQLLLLSALVEASLDQSDEDDVPADCDRPAALAREMEQELSAVLMRPPAERLFDGVRVVLAGPPNAGKSTLMNALAQRPVAITSPIAGTTRDVIEAPVQLGGIAFVLTDTAGLRAASSDMIEKEGIDRANRQIEAADLVVWLEDEPPPARIAEGKLIIIAPRADISGRPVGDRLAVSAVTGQGVAELTAMLVERARMLLPREGEVALNRRQRDHLGRVAKELGQFLEEPDELIRAEHLRRCRVELDALTGRAGTEEMLDALFGTFCIGK